MRLEPLYVARFTTPERWSVDLAGEHGVEGQSFLVVEGRTDGRISSRLRAANWPRRRTDGTATPDFRGSLVTDDGAVVLFAWHGYGRASAAGGPSELVGSLTHITDDPRYRWLNTSFCVVAGEARPHPAGGLEVVLAVSELVWEPIVEGV